MREYCSIFENSPAGRSREGNLQPSYAQPLSCEGISDEVFGVCVVSPEIQVRLILQYYCIMSNHERVAGPYLEYSPSTECVTASYVGPSFVPLVAPATMIGT